MSYIYFNLNNNKFSIIIFIFASLPIFIKITSLSTTWDSNLSKYSSTTLPRAFPKRALPPIESTTYIHRYRSPFPPVFIPNFLLLAQKKKKLSKAILSKKFEETFIASTSLHSIPIRMDRARGRESFDCGDGLHGVSTTGTPHRSHTLRNRSFHCPAYTTRFIILFIATTRNYCPSDLNPRFRFHLRPYREGPDNRPAPGLSPPTKVANEVACLIMENS